MLKKRSRKVILLILIVLAVFAGWWIWVISAGNIQHEDIYVEYTSKEAGAPDAIVIYQPGRTSFSQEVAEDLAEGVQDAGYNVVLTTPGDKFTKDLSGFEVIVFESPIYMSTSTKAMGTYIESVENFGAGKMYFCCTGMLTSTPEFEVINALFENKKLDGLFKVDKGTLSETETYAYDLGMEIAAP